MPISKIKSSGIEADSVTGSSILDGTVDTADLANGAVTSAKLDTNIDIAGTLDVTGATTLDDTLTVSGTSTFQNNISVGSNTNLLTNGDFTTDTTGWTANTSSLASVSGELELTPNISVNGYASQQVDNLVVGRSYIASITVTVDANSFSRLYIGTTVTGNEVLNNINLGVGTHSFSFVATATTHYFTLVVGGGTGQVTRFDNARLYEASSITFPAASGNSPAIIQGNSVNDLAITTNNINRLNVSNDGYVTKPNQPAFCIFGDTNPNFITDGSDTTIYTGHLGSGASAFDHNIGSHWSYATGRFTAPVAGRYIFSFTVTTNDTNSHFVDIHKNGARVGGHALSYAVGYITATKTVILDLAANDYVDARRRASGYSFYSCNFAGYLLG
jgi:hypothetical protein